MPLQDPTITSWLVNVLLSAPKIARDTAPFFWTYLDAPRDGQIMLAWQPLQRMGTIFASDGYVWPTPDEFHARDLKNGLVSSALLLLVLRFHTLTVGRSWKFSRRE